MNRDEYDWLLADDDELYRRQVLEARRMSPQEKLLVGPKLFDRACEIMTAAIRRRNPEWDDQHVRCALSDALEYFDYLEKEAGWSVYLPSESLADYIGVNPKPSSCEIS